MRTTLEIDDDVLAAAKKLAAERRTTVGRVLSELAANELARHGLLIRNGIAVLPATGRAVTSEFIDELLEQIDLADAGLGKSSP
jgi:hypothetical protein